MNFKKAFPITVLILSASFFISSCGKEKFSLTRPLLGTVINITVNSDRNSAVKAVNAAFVEIERIQALFSYYNNETDISRLNKDGAKSMVQLTPEVFELLKLSVDISSKTSGAFDITFASLAPLWNLRDENFVPPSSMEVSKLLKYVSYKYIVFDNQKVAARFTKTGVKVDLGGIAKGYAILKAVEVLKQHGISSGFVDAGGDIQVIGENSGKPWVVGIKNPSNNGIVGTLALSGNDSVATSGSYERFKEYQGKRYHHIIDPKSGYPADSGLISVSVICSDPVLADAYATSFFVMGFDKTAKFLKGNNAVSAILIDDKEKVFVSKSLREKVKFTDYNIQHF